ncbi:MULTISPECIES: DMT family transporter [unclassified Microbacterium]|uniref:DMT family transporter n=1 Tax=unclassified Microbacterium TaxID=2609290 RepID=UPI00214CE482|nr:MULTISPECIES: DMT family transporter [unclassified Microbacterium]MCR2783887.1 DMT family transporter [Microbacterium sp. zg.B96]WIM15267.1 DMT family transporter [Microbacterium sp. zg-B96]
MTAALALLASLFLGIADFLGGALSRRVPQITVLVLSQLVATLAVIPRVLAEPIGADALPAYGWGIVSGVGAAVGVSALYRALAIGTMGVVAPIAALSVLVPVVAGFVGGDAPGALLLGGMTVAIIGTVCASGPELRRGKGGGGLKPILLSLVAALGFGVNNLAVAWGSDYDISATLVANVVTTLVIYVIAMLMLRVVPRARGRNLVGIVAIGVLGFTANLCFAIASESGMLSVVAVCASVFPAVTAVLGWWFLKERLLLVQILGVALVLGGVAVVALST